MSWSAKPLSDVADFSLGKMLDQAKNRGEPMPYLANVNVRWGEFDLTDLREMRFEPDEIDRYAVRPGDIVMCEGGEPGRCAIWKGEREGVMLQKALHRIRPRPGLDASFLYYSFLHLGRSGAFAPLFTGATIKHLPREQLAKVVVQYPAEPEQKAIAETLANYDDLIATNQRRITLLERAARLLYREWFVQLRFPGHESVPVRNGVPDGWVPGVFSDLVAVNPRTSFDKDREYPFVDMGALSESSMVIGERSARKISGGAKFQNGDTLFARITPCIQNGKTGFVQFLEEVNSAASGSTEFIVFRSAKVNPWWVYCLSREDDFRQHAINSMAGSDGRQRVNPKCFDQYAVLQPPAAVLDQFEAAVRDSFTQIEVLSRTNQQLARARDLLLPKLMSGQLDVSRLPLPEEAMA